MSSTSRPVFLGWDRPVLPAAIDHLRQRFARGATWDLRETIVVVPGRRAGRRLLELMAFAAAEDQLDFSPPLITTEGQLPELLYQPQRPFAEPLVQELAWSQVLQELEPAELAAIAPHRPAADDATSWLALGRMLRGLHTELAAELLDFAAVLSRASQLPNFPESARWSAMCRAQQRYLARLDALQLWDIQTARRVAVQQQEIRTDHEIILLGTVDLNRTLRAMLALVASQVTPLVAAPAERREAFDELGCLRAAAWRTAQVPLRAEQILRVDGPAEQADAVTRILASFEGQYRSDQITIGVTDELFVRHLQRQLEQCGVPVRWVQGKRLAETGPLRLLMAVANFLAGETAVAFAALARHPDVYDWLTRGTEQERVGLTWLTELDTLQSEHLVTRIDLAHWPRHASQPRRRGTATTEEPVEPYAQLRRALARVSNSLAPLQGKPRLLSEWSPLLLALLRTIYAEAELTRDSLAALEVLRKVLDSQGTIPPELDRPLSATEALAWTVRQLSEEVVPPPADDEAVELLGWLELPLDDAPALIVTSFNEGYVPQAVTAHPFLPNSLRRHLGLLDNDRRYAREVWNVSLLLHSRKQVRFVVARRDTNNNPLIPSRLLFAVPDTELVPRAAALFGTLPAATPREPLLGRGYPLPSRSALVVPRPRVLPDAWDSIRITQFRDYLACPYRFYLRHVLRLSAIENPGEELAGNQFGNLAHDVLQRFGRDEQIRDSDSPAAIAHWLDEQLALRARLAYGEPGQRAALDLQLEQLRARLHMFAHWQAERVRAGWQIVYTESTGDEAGDIAEPTAPFRVGEIEIALRGRIDRIDRHCQRDELAIFDYKTADQGEPPQKTHRRREQWIDLQLPLYRHLACAWGHEAEVVHLGYILLPRDLGRVGAATANWNAQDLAEADATAREVIEAIRAHKFWPPSEAPEYPDHFSAICQDHRLGGPQWEDVP